MGTSFVPEVAASFLETKPDKSIQFEFFSEITSSLLDGLKQDKYDVVFCTKIDQEVDIDFTPVEKQDLVLIVPRNHPLANHHSIDLSETLPYPQVYFSKGSGLRSIIDKLFEKIDGKPTVAYEIEEDEVVAGLVSKGFGHCCCTLYGAASAAECKDYSDFLSCMGKKFPYGYAEKQISLPCCAGIS